MGAFTGMPRKLKRNAEPQTIAAESGAEILRLWAALTDYSEDQRIGRTILQTTTDAYRKLRNTLRFALGVLEDFDPKRDALLTGQLAPLDRYLRSRAHQFLKKVREVAASLNIPQDMLRRGVNVGFSGGEKKRNEILQMALFQPSLCILDEMDSGLDIDALRVAADGVNALRSPERAMVVITHYQRLLNYIVPDVVHVMSKGRVVKSGGKELALELEASGYAQFEDAA